MPEIQNPAAARNPAPRSTRKEVVQRETRILRMLTAGVNGAEIARREGLSPRRTREMIQSFFARRRDMAPVDFVDLQVTRLQEALVVAYAAMNGGNMKAVAMVVKIVRELDRYHGLTAEAALAAPYGNRARRQIERQVPDRIEGPAANWPTLPAAAQVGSMEPRESPESDARRQDALQISDRMESAAAKPLPGTAAEVEVTAPDPASPANDERRQDRPQPVETFEGAAANAPAPAPTRQPGTPGVASPEGGGLRRFDPQHGGGVEGAAAGSPALSWFPGLNAPPGDRAPLTGW
jgi:hypothetical protein